MNKKTGMKILKCKIDFNDLLYNNFDTKTKNLRKKGAKIIKQEGRPMRNHPQEKTAEEQIEITKSYTWKSKPKNPKLAP